MTPPKLATEFDSAQASPGFLLWQVTNKWQAEQRRALAPFGLTHVQFVLLASLAWADADEAGMSQRQLAAVAKTDVMMTSQVVRTLEQKELLTREASPSDRRTILVAPTAEGVTLVNEAVVAVEAVDRRFFADLGAEVGAFTRMMQRLAA